MREGGDVYLSIRDGRPKVEVSSVFILGPGGGLLGWVGPEKASEGAGTHSS